jgi:hypothetical protein
MAERTVTVEPHKGGYAVRLDDEVITRTTTEQDANKYAARLRAQLKQNGASS